MLYKYSQQKTVVPPTPEQEGETPAVVPAPPVPAKTVVPAPPVPAKTVVPEPPKQDGKSYSAPSAGPIKSNVPYLSSYQSIQKMQIAMQEFAKSVADYSSLPLPTQKQSPAAGGVAPIQDKKSEIGGRKAFNDFITEQYLSTSNIKGVEWDPNPALVTREQKKQRETDLIEMDVVVDSLRRIGKPKSELKADGIWDFRTNNALLNIYTFATALLQLYKDFSTTAPGMFNNTHLQIMYNNIIKPDDAENGNPSKVPANEKHKRAEALTSVLNKLTSFYNAYVKKIATNPWYKQYIDGASMYTVKPFVTDPAAKTQEENNLLKNADGIDIKNLVLTNKNGTQQTFGAIPVGSLTDIKRLKEIAYGLQYSSNEVNNDVLKRIVSEIMSQIDSRLQSIKQQPTSI